MANTIQGIEIAKLLNRESNSRVNYYDYAARLLSFLMLIQKVSLILPLF